MNNTLNAEAENHVKSEDGTTVLTERDMFVIGKLFSAASDQDVIDNENGYETCNVRSVREMVQTSDINALRTVHGALYGAANHDLFSPNPMTIALMHDTVVELRAAGIYEPEVNYADDPKLPEMARIWKLTHMSVNPDDELQSESFEDEELRAEVFRIAYENVDRTDEIIELLNRHGECDPEMVREYLSYPKPLAVGSL